MSSDINAKFADSLWFAFGFITSHKSKMYQNGLTVQSRFFPSVIHIKSHIWHGPVDLVLNGFTEIKSNFTKSAL